MNKEKIVDINSMKRIVIISANPFEEFKMGEDYVVPRWLGNYLVERGYAEFQCCFENDIKDWI